MMKSLKKYPSFKEGIKNSVQDEEFSYEEFREYFIFYSNEKKEDLSFFFDYVKTFFPSDLDKLLKEYPIEILFKKRDVHDLRVAVVLKKVIVTNDLDKTKVEYDLPLDFKVGKEEEAIIRYLSFLDQSLVVKLLHLNYL